MAEAVHTPTQATAPAAPAEPTEAQVAQTMRSKQYIVLLVIVAIIGVLVSVVAWCFLELVNQLQRELYTHLPNALGYTHGPPLWWPLPILTIGALLVALAISRLPGEGGHLPARGLAAGGGPPSPITMPGVLLAAIATIASGLVLGPEAPLIVLGGGTAVIAIGALRRDTPPTALALVAAAGSFAAISFLFASPLIAAVIIIEAGRLGGARMPLVLLPGLLAAGIGTLVSLGIGSFTGLSNQAYALTPISVAHFGHPTVGQFGWTILLAVLIAVGARLLMAAGLRTHGLVNRRLMMMLPLVGLVIAGLAIAFHGITGKSFQEVLFDGQSALPGLVSNAGTWSVAALIWLLLFKGIAYALSLGSFRGGPTFPAVFLGAAAGLLASRLPGFPLTPALAVAIGASVAAVLQLPLSAIVLAMLMTESGGVGDGPLIIVGVVVAYLTSLFVIARLDARDKSSQAETAPVSSGARSGDPAPATASGALTS